MWPARVPSLHTFDQFWPFDWLPNVDLILKARFSATPGRKQFDSLLDPFLSGNSTYPSNDAGDTVHGNLCAVRNSPRRVGDAENHRHASFARQRREVRRAAAAFGDDARHARQNVCEGRPADARHEDVTRRDATQLALALNDHGPARCPTDSRRVTAQSRMLQPNLVGHVCRLHMQRARLEKLEAFGVESPFDFDRRPDDVFGAPQQAADLQHLRLVEARLGGKRRRHRFG